MSPYLESPYLEERPHEISYEIPAGETEEHLCQLGEHLVALVEALREEAPKSEAHRLAERVLPMCEQIPKLTRPLGKSS